MHTIGTMYAYPVLGCVDVCMYVCVVVYEIPKEGRILAARSSSSDLDLNRKRELILEETLNITYFRTLRG